MTDHLKMAETIKNYAIENFKHGLNCGECVLEALIRASALDMPPQAVRLVTGFGGGMGLSGFTCGALSAAIVANGAVHGRSDPWGASDEERSKELAAKYYRRYNRLTHDFIKANRSPLCREISAPFGDWHGRDRLKTCLKLIGATAALAYEYLVMPEEEASKLSYGPNMSGLE